MARRGAQGRHAAEGGCVHLEGFLPGQGAVEPIRAISAATARTGRSRRVARLARHWLASKAGTGRLGGFCERELSARGRRQSRCVQDGSRAATMRCWPRRADRAVGPNAAHLRHGARRLDRALCSTAGGRTGTPSMPCNQVPTILSLLTPEYQQRFVQEMYHYSGSNAPQWAGSYCWPEGFMRRFAQYGGSSASTSS